MLMLDDIDSKDKNTNKKDSIFDELAKQEIKNENIGLNLEVNLKQEMELEDDTTKSLFEPENELNLNSLNKIVEFKKIHIQSVSSVDNDVNDVK